MKRQFKQFLTRWLLNTVGLFVAAQLLAAVDYRGGLLSVVVAGLILSVINAIIKPTLTLLALPALVLTLGLFSLLINGLLIYLVQSLYQPFQVKGLLAAVVVGVIIGAVNYLLTRLFEVLTPRDG